MKSNKQRRLEIRAKRRKRAEKLAIDTIKKPLSFPDGHVMANWDELKHNNTYGPLPNFYVDRAFTCEDCGSEELWTAKQQKWWYEVAKGNINTTAIRCLPCRKRIAADKEAQKRHMAEIALKKPHPNEAFFKST